MRFLFALLVTLMVGCSVSIDPPDACRTFVVAPEFSAEERQGLELTVERWNAIATEPFCLRSSTRPGEAESATHGVFSIHYGGAYWQQISANAGGADILGIHFGGVDRIGIIDGMSAETFGEVALHEFGHAHGLGHIDPPAIMCAYAGSASDFTPGDMAECHRVGACSSGSDAGTTPSGVQFTQR